MGVNYLKYKGTIAVVIILLAIAAVVFFAPDDTFTQISKISTDSATEADSSTSLTETTSPDETNNLAQLTTITTDISVNGEIITKDEIDEAYSKLPEDVKGAVTKGEVAETLVNQRLLLQEADGKGISTTDEEIDAYIEQVMEFGGLSEEEFVQQISDVGYTVEGYRDSITKTLTISKLLDQELDLQSVVVTDAEVDSFIEENKEQFADVYEEDNEELINLFRGRVRIQLEQEKRLQLANIYIDILKETATIEY